MSTLERILNHPDKDEIISKLIIDIPEKDIHDWLESKYSNPGESKFVVAKTTLKDFKDNFLDIYSKIKEDILKVKNDPNNELELTLKNNKAYKAKILELTDKKIDIEEKVSRLITAIEDRAAEVFDKMQNQEIDFKKDTILINYLGLLGETLSKYYDMKEKEEKKQLNNVTNINNTNVTIQVLDQQVSIFYDIFKQVLETLDFETSMRCLELFNEKLSKARLANTKEFTLDQQIAEVKLLNDTVQKRLNE
jgi:hypothetical protein